MIFKEFHGGVKSEAEQESEEQSEDQVLIPPSNSSRQAKPRDLFDKPDISESENEEIIEKSKTGKSCHICGHYLHNGQNPLFMERHLMTHENAPFICQFCEAPFKVRSFY